MGKEPITITAVGDVILDRPDPVTGFEYVGPVFRDADLAIVNMEQVLGDGGEKDPRQGVSHGSRFVEPYVAYDVDYVSAATNHSMDWGAEGLMGTIEVLNSAGIAYSGIGRNLEEARKPAILERKGNKIGILNYCSVAYEDRNASSEKPGVAGIRVWTVYEDIDFAPAAPPIVHSMVHKESMDMVKEDIEKLRSQVDVLIVIYHWGQIIKPIDIPEYCIELGRASIDAGADIVIGHHPHILKGAEIYNGKPIFYSLGNMFIDFQGNFGEDDKKMIGGLIKLYKPTPQDLLDRSNTFVLKMQVEDGKIDKVSLLPAYLNDNNTPEMVKRDDAEGRGESVRSYMARISAAAGLNGKYDWINDEEVLFSSYSDDELREVIASYGFAAPPDWEA